MMCRVGVIGSLPAGLLFRLIGLAATGLVGSLVTATGGACRDPRNESPGDTGLLNASPRRSHIG